VEGFDELDGGAPLLSPLDARVEAALFAAVRPVQEREFAVLLPDGSDVYGALRRVAAFWEGRGILVLCGPDGWTMRTRTDLLPDASSKLRRFTDAAGATLIAIAMHQPVTVQQIEAIRGVKLARDIVEGFEKAGLVRAVGRRRGSGRAVMWEVTEKFLEWAELDQLSDLPSPEEAMMLDLVADGSGALAETFPPDSVAGAVRRLDDEAV
jgi:segregation and condensation protein B